MLAIVVVALFSVVIVIGGIGLYWKHKILSDPGRLSRREKVARVDGRTLSGQALKVEAEFQGAPIETSLAVLDDSLQEVRKILSSPVMKVSSLPPIPKLPRPPSIYETTREPEDGSDLFIHPHEKYFPVHGEAYNLAYGWQIIGASRRGYRHAFEGKYREDDFQIRLFSNGVALVAIADGLGSKSLSRRGAQAAVSGATRLPEQKLQELARLAHADAGNEVCQQAAKGVLIAALHAARARVEERAREDQVNVDALQTTLLVFLVVPCNQRHLFISSVQVGDGALFALHSSESDQLSEKWCCLQRPQLQEAGNEVEPFNHTGIDTWNRFLQCELLEDAIFVMGMTDGTSDDIEPPRATAEVPNPDPFLYVDDFYQHLQSHVLSKPSPAEALIEFLGYKKRGSYDDRTVICLYRLEGGQNDAG
jgi:hypothetical protein